MQTEDRVTTKRFASSPLKIMSSYWLLLCALLNFVQWSLLQSCHGKTNVLSFPVFESCTMEWGISKEGYPWACHIFEVSVQILVEDCNLDASAEELESMAPRVLATKKAVRCYSHPCIQCQAWLLWDSGWDGCSRSWLKTQHPPTVRNTLPFEWTVASLLPWHPKSGTSCRCVDTTSRTKETKVAPSPSWKRHGDEEEGIFVEARHASYLGAYWLGDPQRKMNWSCCLRRIAGRCKEVNIA